MEKLLFIMLLVVFGFSQDDSFINGEYMGFKWIQSANQMAVFIEADEEYLGNTFGAFYFYNGILMCCGSVVWDNQLDEVVVMAEDMSYSGFGEDCFTGHLPSQGSLISILMYDPDENIVYTTTVKDYHTDETLIIPYESMATYPVKVEIKDPVGQYEWLTTAWLEDATLSNISLCRDLAMEQAKVQALINK